LSGLTKRVIATTKLSIFDVVLSASRTPSEGYEKPNKAQTANTKNIAAKENNVYLDSFIRDDSVSSENVETSTRKSGRKKSSLNSVGYGGIGGNVHRKSETTQLNNSDVLFTPRRRP
jgi:hypothetical protein